MRALVLLSLAAALLSAPFASAATSDVVVSQVYAGGGNAGATYANDFVELFNRGSASVDVAGWTVQYASAASTSWSATALSGTIAPGRHYLVQLASAGSVGIALPTPDATGTTNLAASGGKIALVHDTAPLTCGASPGSCSASPLVEDLVGYGTATDYEGAAAAPGLTSTTAVLRGAGGCTDTDGNVGDFASGVPTPRHLATAAAACSAAPPATSATAAAAVDVEIQPVLSVALERPTLSFGKVFAGDVPPAISERVTVVSNSPSGYALTVHRAAFAPADLPLGIASSAAASLVPIPVAPAADLVLASTSGATTAVGDVWPASVGFTAPLPSVPPGRYTTTVTFTVIGR